MKKLTIRKIRWKYLSWFFVPRGDYCYKGSRAPNNKKYKECPYWDYIEELPEQESGYCHYLKYGDNDINNDENRILIDMKTGEKIPAPEMPITIGLLWDQVKECRLKPNWEEIKIDLYFKWRKLIGKKNKCGNIILTKKQIKSCIKTAKKLNCEYLIIINGEKIDEYRKSEREFETPRYVKNQKELEKSIKEHKWNVEKILEINLEE